MFDGDTSECIDMRYFNCLYKTEIKHASFTLIMQRCLFTLLLCVSDIPSSYTQLSFASEENTCLFQTKKNHFINKNSSNTVSFYKIYEGCLVKYWQVVENEKKNQRCVLKFLQSFRTFSSTYIANFK